MVDKNRFATDDDDGAEDDENEFSAVAKSMDQEQDEQAQESQTESVSESQTGSVTDEEQSSESASSANRVRDKKHVNLYLDEDFAGWMDEKVEEFIAEYEAQSGNNIQKNRHVWPLIVAHGVRELESMSADEVTEAAFLDGLPHPDFD